MKEDMSKQKNSNLISARRGQTLVIAIMVMFILAVVSAVFIALVGRNLFRSERLSNVDAVAQIAEAGVRFADKMLTSSEDGADWRPKPDNLGFDSDWVPDYNNPPGAPSDLDTLKKNPDFKWLRPYWPTDIGYAGPTGGYTKFESGGGRFLLRLTYSPSLKDPISKFIKIESIGRWGVVDNDDPTTWAGHGNSGMRREITAYKPIGLTDYLRFITNKDHRSVDFALGCPGMHMIYGRPGTSGSSVDPSRYGERGAPIRVNGNLIFYGIPSTSSTSSSDYPSVDIFLRGVASSTGTIPLDAVEVSGVIKQYSSDSGSVGVRVNTIEPDRTIPYQLGLPSDDTSATDWSIGGFWRDGSAETSGSARHIKYLDPPQIDNADTTNTTTRYRLLTLNSGEQINVGGKYVNAGRYGWGRGIYIDNSNDVQNESNTLFGGYSLRSDWLKPNNRISSYWNGPFYTPPGVYILLNPRDTDGDGQADMTITRTDGSAWCDPDGNARSDWGRTITVPYPDPTNGRDLKWKDTNGTEQSIHVDGNGVVYAEGNIRIRGMLPPHMQLTVVSNSNIYVEGSVLKYRDPDASVSNTDPWRGTYSDNGSTETCGIALLARQNVCVNTTQFYSPLAGSGKTDNDNSVIISSDPDSRLRMLFEFGPYESDKYTSGGPDGRMLLLRHSGQFGTSYINAWLNARSGLNDWGILHLNTDWDGLRSPANLPEHIWGIGDPNFNPQGFGIDSSYFGEVFPLFASGMNAHFYSQPGIPNDLTIALDQTTFTRNNYLMAGLAVVPMDVRIEALIYAQEGSLFVIPGKWFNPNPDDTASKAASYGRPEGVRKAFPFFGQPLDIRIIIDGTVSENMPAAISDVNEWMSKWGKIPSEYGSSGISTVHPGEGLTLLYDDHAGWPYTGLRGSGTLAAIRKDKYGRTLPLAPRLPVCGGLIYFGDVM